MQSSSDPDTVEPLAAEPGSTPARARCYRVLVIDDNEIIHRVVRRVLKDHLVDRAESGPEALALLESGAAYDVVLLDLHLPGMRGVDLFATLVAEHPSAASRVIILSGGGFDAQTAEFLEQSKLPLIEKPFDPAQLKATILARAQAGTAPAATP